MTALAPSPPRDAVATRRVRPVAAALGVAALAAAGAVATYHAAVRTPLGQAVDTAAMRGADVDHPRVVEVLDRTLTGTTLGGLLLVCLAVAAVGVLRRRVDLAVGAAVLVLAANGAAQLAKARLDRPPLDGFPAPNSLPGGHVVAAASVVFALVLVLPAALRGTVALAGAGYVTVVAVATVWAEWHRPADAVAGMLLVLACGAAVVAGLRLWRGTAAGEPAPVRLVGPLLGTVAALGAALGAPGLAAVAVAVRVTPGFVSGRFAFAAGAALVAAAVAGTVLVWVRLAAGGRRAAPNVPVEEEP